MDEFTIILWPDSPCLVCDTLLKPEIPKGPNAERDAGYKVRYRCFPCKYECYALTDGRVVYQGDPRHQCDTPNCNTGRGDGHQYTDLHDARNVCCDPEQCVKCNRHRISNIRGMDQSKKSIHYLHYVGPRYHPRVDDSPLTKEPSKLIEYDWEAMGGA